MIPLRMDGSMFDCWSHMRESEVVGASEPGNRFMLFFETDFISTKIKKDHATSSEEREPIGIGSCLTDIS